MLTIIFRLILAIVHLGYVAYEIIKFRCDLVRSYTRKIYSRIRKGSGCWTEDRTKDETLELKSSVERVHKLPVHLCIVVGGYEERISFRHLARVLGWCIAMGIPYVSFYDHDGLLKGNRSILRMEYEKMSPKHSALVRWESGTASTPKFAKNGCNGFKYSTRVQIFSNEDGKGEIVELARNLSRAVVDGLLKIEEIDAKLLEDKLRLENLPDPDLAFVCGPTLSTYGLLPWHIRTTEFFNLRSYRDISIYDFTRLLEKYSTCQQRYGK